MDSQQSLHQGLIQLGNYVPMQENTSQSWHTPQIEVPQGGCMQEENLFFLSANFPKRLPFVPEETRYSRMKIKRNMIIKTDSGLETFLDINKDVIQNPQAWEKIFTARQYRTEPQQSTVKRELSIHHTSVNQDRTLVNTVPEMKPDLSFFTNDDLLISRNNAQNVASVNVKPEYSDNSQISSAVSSNLQQRSPKRIKISVSSDLQQKSPKRIKIEIPRPGSPTLFNIDSLKQES